jgi:hypothetical protein
MRHGRKKSRMEGRKEAMLKQQSKYKNRNIISGNRSIERRERIEAAAAAETLKITRE